MPQLNVPLLVAILLLICLASAQTSPPDCWSQWSAWSQCSGSPAPKCSYGNHNRTRSIVIVANNNTKTNTSSSSSNVSSCTGDSIQQQPCNLCATDCIYTNWSAWSACSTQCDTGVAIRTRTVSQQPQFGGLSCTQLLADAKACNANPCPDYCLWHGWSEWSTCSLTCGGGVRFHNRSQEYNPLVNITKLQAQNITCDLQVTEAGLCNIWNCFDCVYSEWSLYSPCSVDCGHGEMLRRRVVIQEANNGGQPCSGEDAQTMGCNDDPCPYAENANDGKQLSTFTVVAVVIGGLLGLVLIAVGMFLYLYFRRRQLNRALSEIKHQNSNPENQKPSQHKDTIKRNGKGKEEKEEKEEQKDNDDDIEVPLESVEPNQSHSKPINKKSAGKFTVY